MIRYLTFGQLRMANLRRLPLFKNGRGERAHASDDGSDWRLSQWSNALAGEVGELCNLVKKIERGDFTLDEAREELSKECADVAIYLDLTSMNAGINLDEAIVGKFNETSEKQDISVRLEWLEDHDVNGGG